jgi:hypothetical protein
VRLPIQQPDHRALDDVEGRILVPGLRVNSFLRLRRLFAGGRHRIEVEELGTAEGILENRGYLRQAAKGLHRGTRVPAEQRWGGWLGRDQRAVRRATHELQSERDRTGIER